VFVEPFRGRYRILEEKRDAEQVIDMRAAIDHLYARLFYISIEERPRSGIIHAALLRRRGRRILIAGSKGAGKTSLALHLVRSGYEFEGDEHAFVDIDGVIARPRACRVKETSLPLLPDITDAILSAPVYVDVRGSRVFSLAPSMIGASWRIERGNVDCVFVLQPNHGGYSSIRPMPAMMTAQSLISEIGMRRADRGASIGAIAALVNLAKCFDLSLGDHEGATKCIERALDDPQ